MYFVFLTKLGVSRRFQPAIYSVFDEESESEVQNRSCRKTSKCRFQNFKNKNGQELFPYVLFKKDSTVP